MGTFDDIQSATHRTIQRHAAEPAAERELSASDRAWIRYALGGTVTLKDPSTHSMKRGYIVDISAGGIAFHVPIDLAVHSYTYLQVTVGTLELFGQLCVLRKEGYKYAGSFVGLPADERVKLDCALRNLHVERGQ